MNSAPHRPTTGTSQGSTPRHGIDRLQNGHSLLDNATAFVTNWKVSQIVNPDGTLTVRRMVLNPDGSRSIRQEDYPYLNNELPEYTPSRKADVPLLEASDSDSSMSPISTIKASPSRVKYSSDVSDRSNLGLPRRSKRQQQDIGKYKQCDDTASTDISYLTSSGGSTKPMNLGETETVPEDGSSSGVVVTGYAKSVGFRPRPMDPVPSNISKPSPSATHTTESGISVDEDSHDWYPGYESSTLFSALTGDTIPDNHLLERERAAASRDMRVGTLRLPSLVPSATTEYSTTESIGNFTSSSEAAPAIRLKPRTKGQPVVSGDRKFRLTDIDPLPQLVSPISEEGGYSNTSTPKQQQQYVVTVVKKAPSDKLGIHVGLKLLACGRRLVVSKISPDGLFVETPIYCGDIVVSINGKSFLENPSTSTALALVRNAKDKVTFVVQMRGKDDDDRSVDEPSEPSQPFEHVRETTNPDMTRTVTKVIWNEDGSQTIIVEDFDEDGTRTSRTIRMRIMNADGSLTFVTEEQSAKPVSLEEPFNMPGDLTIAVRKKSTEHEVGLSLITRETPNGPVLFVSHINPTGLFFKTPLRVGDVVLSINSINFRENPDAKMASLVMQRVERNLTVVAKKFEESLKEFLFSRGNKKQTVNRRIVETIHIPAPKFDLEFDRETYGGSLDGYRASESVKITKSSPAQELGIDMAIRLTAWGSLLVVTKISPSSKSAATKLKVGDAVLAINGVNFREDPDAHRATSLLRQAETDVVIEYQRLASLKPALPPTIRTKSKVTESRKPNGAISIRTETVIGDGSTAVKLEEFCPELPFDGPYGNPRDLSGLVSVLSDLSDVDTASQEGRLRVLGDRKRPKAVQRDKSGTTKSTHKSDSESLAPKSSAVFLPEVGENSSDTALITIEKIFPEQEVGISMATMGGVLYATKISLTGLLVGKPILPGDIILSINNKNFRENPNAKEAFTTIINARETVTMEVLKTSNKNVRIVHESDNRKAKWHARLSCSKKRAPKQIFSWPEGPSIPDEFTGSPSFDKMEAIERRTTARTTEAFDPFFV